MLDTQDYLVNRYQSLRNSRSAPVFFIEHGLTESEVEDLIIEVRSALDVYSLENGWWETHSLPLIVVATEVGYRYRGNGTDFWPVLEERLDSSISTQARQRIRDLFFSASRKYHGAIPPDTPWAEAFHLIAWPITHALVPIDFHRPLALTLSNLRVNASSLDDETLYNSIRTVAGSSSARFLTLIEQPSLIVSVARSLLGEEVSELCNETTKRIANDITSDHVARKNVSVAQRIQRTVSKGGNVRTKQPEPVPAVKGNIQLRRIDERIILEASFPMLEEKISSRLRNVLRRRRFAPRIWGVTAPVPSEQLLSSLPFALKFTTPPEEDAPLLQNVEHLELDDDLLDVLMAFELDFAPPIVFAVGADSEVARRIHGPEISGHRKYWVLAKPNPPLDGLTSIGEVGPYTCYTVDPKEEDARQVLTSLGFTVRFGVSVAFAGSPMLDRNASIPSFVAGDKRVIVPRQSLPEGLVIDLDGSETSAKDGDVIRVNVDPGEHLLRVSSGGESKEYPYSGVTNKEASHSSICSISTGSTEISVQALLSGRLTFSVESFAPIENLELTVEIEAGGRRMSAFSPLGPLPQIVSSGLEPFATLLDNSTRDLLMQVTDVSVRLSVSSICTRSWVLEHRVQKCWWDRRPEGHMVLMSELGELQYGGVAATTPNSPPDPKVSVPTEGVYLLAPIGLDTSEFKGDSDFNTYCVAPPRAPLIAPPVRKPRLVRRRRAENSGTGLEDITESYLRWSLAEAGTMIAEMRRRQIANELDNWMAELCCGVVWAHNESGLCIGDSWQLLVNICNKMGLCHDSYVELSEKDKLEITRISVEEIRRTQPEIFVRIGPPNDLDYEDYEELDLACGRAYLKLANEYRKRGKHNLAAEIEEGDPGAAAEDWEEALARVKGHIEMPTLAGLLLPTDSTHRLVLLDPSMMTLDGLVDELSGWVSEARSALYGNVPGSDTLKAILSLWAEPETAIHLDWRGALDTMIAERAISRAARYLTLKSRQMKRGGVE